MDDGSQSVTGAKEGEVTVCKIPRWDFARRSHSEAVAEITRLARILKAGDDGLCNLYLKICDMIRDHKLSDKEVRQILNPIFPPPRVSEFLKIAKAPNDVYMRYRFGLIGFRGILNLCRAYTVTGGEELKRRKVRRAAERLIHLMGCGEVKVCGVVVTISKLAITS